MKNTIPFFVAILFFSGFFLSCRKEATTVTLFELLPPSATGITFENTLPDNDALNIIQYLYYYNGAGVAVGDVNNDGLPDIFLAANRKPNKLYLNKGNFKFEDITEKAGVAGSGDWKTGVNMADVNGDGWLDIYVCQVSNYKGLKGKNQLFINNANFSSKGDAIFSEKAADYHLDFQGFAQQIAFFDYDKDGDLDAYLLCHSVHSQSKSRDSTLRLVPDAMAGDKFLRNDGSTFTDVTAQTGIFSSKIGFGLGIAVGDLNGDGWQDMYVSNDFYENDYLYYNNGNGTFREAIRESCGHTSNFSMGTDIADANNDGLPDIISLDMKPHDEVLYRSVVGADAYDIYRFKKEKGFYYQFPRNNFQLNRGNLFDKKTANFSEIGQFSGISATDWSWSAFFADLDNDGWKDIYITNGIVRRPDNLDYLKFISNISRQKNASDADLIKEMPPNSIANFAYRNQKDLTFEDVSTVWGLDTKGFSNGAAYADFDNDGDLDLIVNNINAPASIYKNKINENKKRNYLKVNLKGEKQNTFGIGAKIDIFTQQGLLHQEQSPTRGWLSSVDYTLHFGLDSLKTVDSLVVTWLDGKKQQLKNVAANQTLTLNQRDASEKPLPISSNQKTIFTPKSGLIDYKHSEDAFTDMDVERLMPYSLATQSPKIAVADENKDGFDDVFLIDNQLFTYKNNRFIKQILPIGAKAEITSSALFDADHDHDLDILIAFGGNESINNQDLQPELWLNENGKYVLSKGTLPAMNEQVSCVRAADFDQDGDIDVFLGGRVVASNFGISPKSYFLKNNGGKFSDETPTELQRLGMVTDAAWGDIDGDKDLDLVVVGDFMPITIIENNKGQLTLTPHPSLTSHPSLTPHPSPLTPLVGGIAFN